MGGGSKDSGKTILGVLGFALGGFNPGMFGTTSWVMGGLYGASLATQLWSMTHKQSYDYGSTTSEFSESTNQISNNAIIPIIYGTRGNYGGYQTYYSLSSGNTIVTKDIVLCEGTSGGISDVNVNDTAIGSLSGCSYSFYDGASSNSPPSNYSETGSYKRCAWLRSTLTASNELSGGNPTVTCTINGSQVLDTRTNITAWSDNPSMCTRDFLLSRRYGLAKYLPDIEFYIDEDSFKEAADYCDELVDCKDVEGNIVQEKRYRLNIILSETASFIDHLANILANFGGYLVISDDKISLRVDKPTVTSYVFNESNMKLDSVEMSQTSIDETYNQYRVSYIDKTNEWTDTTIVIDDIADQKERNRVISTGLNLKGCTSQTQAIRIAKLFMNDGKVNSINISFSTGTYAMGLEAGDVITVSFRSFANKPFRITEISEQDGIWNIKAREYNADIYNQNYYDTINVKNYSIIPSPLTGVVPSVTTLALNEYGWQATDGTHVSTIVCTWPEVEYQFFRSYIVSLSTDGITWTTLANTLTNNFTISNVQPQKYYVKVQVLNSVGRLSTAVTQEVNVTGKDNPPANVTGFSVSQTGEYISFAWDTSTEPDIRTYEIRMGGTWDNSELITQTTTVPYLWLAPGNGTYNFWIKAVDNFGNYSTTATVRSINIFGIAPKNVILSQTIDITDATSTGLYLSPYGYLELQTSDSYDLFADMFIGGNTYVTNAKVELPIVDLGANIIEQENYYIDPWGNVKVKTQETIGSTEFFSDIFSGGSTPVSIKYLAETFLNITPVYNSTPSTSIGIKYQTSIDGNSWSEEVSYLTKQFFGRYVKILLYPKSTKDLLHLEFVKVAIDVPDVEDILLNIAIPAVKTYVKYNRKFYSIPNVAPIVEYGNGDTAIYRKSNITTDGFYLEILDSQGSLVSGVLVQANIRGY